MGTVVILTRPDVLMHRTSESPNALTNYISKVREAGQAFVAANAAVEHVVGTYIVAVKPGRQARVWVEVTGVDPGNPLSSSLAAALQHVEPIAVIDGPVVFAAPFRTWAGGEIPASFELPAVWQKASEKALKPGEPLDEDDILLMLWPNNDR